MIVNVWCGTFCVGSWNRSEDLIVPTIGDTITVRRADLVDRYKVVDREWEMRAVGDEPTRVTIYTERLSDEAKTCGGSIKKEEGAE